MSSFENDINDKSETIEMRGISDYDNPMHSSASSSSQLDSLGNEDSDRRSLEVSLLVFFIQY